MSKIKDPELAIEAGKITPQEPRQFKFGITGLEFSKKIMGDFKPERTERIIIETSPSQQKGMGWMRDLPDIRDYTLKSELNDVSPKRRARGVNRSISEMAKALGINYGLAGLPPAANLTPWFSPIEDQGALGSCTANAGVGIVEYFERRAFGRYINASRLFLYKVTRDLLHWTGDTGAYLRTTMEALSVFGTPPEEYCPYIISNFDNEPSSLCYAFAQNYQAISYFRLDGPTTTPDQLLHHIKSCIHKGVPSMFGFTCYNSLSQANSTGMIPFPSPGEHVIGGHAVVAAGYDDNIIITNSFNGQKSKGAFLIRNSWGTGWGNNGYGWLPYEYVLSQLAVDWWCLLKSEWLDTGRF